MAEQKRALITRAIEAIQDRPHQARSKVQACKEAPETTQDKTAGCKNLAGKAYLEQHNKVGGILYRNIYTKLGLETLKSKWDTPTKVVKNNWAKILLDFQL